MRFRQRRTRMIPRAIAFLAWTASLFGIVVAWPWSVTAPPEPPHPAVARIIALDLKGASLGTGTLVAVSDTHGLVVTNWHVVRDARGAILVLFPDGFASPATVLRTDRDWDLAALAIWRPRATPVAIAQEAPRPGDWLAIAGYGQGAYRTVKGICTQYLAPKLNLPRELVELRAAARQGDSGGPIFNSRGELAGVLFGSGGSETMGSYCGRVREFLAPLKEPFYRLPIPQGMAPQLLAAGPPPLDSGDASNLAAATPNSAVAGTPPLESLSTKGAGTTVDSGSIPLTAVAASSLPGSGKTNYGTAGPATAPNSPFSYSYASNFGSFGSNGSGGWGSAPTRDASGGASAAGSVALSSSGTGGADWRPGSGNDDGGSHSYSYGNGTSGYGNGMSAGPADPRGPGYQAAASPPGKSPPAASSLASGNAPSSWDSATYRDGTHDRGMSSSGDSTRNGGGQKGNTPSSGISTSGSAYAFNSYGSQGYGRETSSTQHGFQGYRTSENADYSRYGPPSSDSSFTDAGTGTSGKYSSSPPSPSDDSGRAGSYAAQGPRDENGTDKPSYSSDLADRTWDYDRERNESQRTRSSGVTASIGGHESRNAYSDRRSESFSARIPDSGSQALSDRRPIPSDGTSRYSGGSSDTTLDRSAYDSAGYQRRSDGHGGYGGYGGAYDNNAGYGRRDSSHGSTTSRSYASSSQDSRASPTLGFVEETAGNGGSAAHDESSPKSYSADARSSDSNSYAYPKSGGASYGRTDTERAGSSVGSEKNGYGGSVYGKRSETDYGHGTAESNPPYASSASAYGLGTADKREHEERDDRYSENKGGTTRYEETKSPNASSRPTSGYYGSSGSGGNATSGSTSSTSHAGSDYRSGHSGYSPQGRSGAESFVSRPTAIPPAEPSADDPSPSHPTDGSVETAAPSAYPATSSQQPPAASSGVGMETLLGLVGLLILFVQSMRWLSGFYDRSYRRRRTWRSTRRRPYYERDVRPVYRSYW